VRVGKLEKKDVAALAVREPPVHYGTAADQPGTLDLF
jgi:hypothetical protein